MAAGIITILAALAPLLVELIRRGITAYDTPTKVEQRQDNELDKMVSKHDTVAITELINDRLSALHGDSSRPRN